MTPREHALTVQLQRKNRAIIAGLLLGIIIGACLVTIFAAEPVWITQVADTCQL